jgi:hypothetical protein
MDDPRPDRTPPDPSGIDEAHDVLAAEEFGMPARDDRFPPDPTGNPEAHDVLAAEEFAMPMRDDRYPPDPTGNPEAHDVLAAEEFAMPTATGPGSGAAGFDLRSMLPAALAIATLLLVVRRLRR